MPLGSYVRSALGRYGIVQKCVAVYKYIRAPLHPQVALKADSQLLHKDIFVPVLAYSLNQDDKEVPHRLLMCLTLVFVYFLYFL
jgi:hypothetical protein